MTTIPSGAIAQHVAPTLAEIGGLRLRLNPPYELYLTHNVIGSAIIRALVEAGFDATSALWIALGLLMLVCWFICAKVEPAVRSALMRALAQFGQLPTRQPRSRRSVLARGLRPSQPLAVPSS